jgi:hypothetical protein
MSTTRALTIHLGPDKSEDPVLRIYSEDTKNWRVDFAWKHRYTTAHSVLVDKRDLDFKLEELENG